MKYIETNLQRSAFEKTNHLYEQLSFYSQTIINIVCACIYCTVIDTEHTEKNNHLVYKPIKLDSKIQNIKYFNPALFAICLSQCFVVLCFECCSIIVVVPILKKFYIICSQQWKRTTTKQYYHKSGTQKKIERRQKNRNKTRSMTSNNARL